MLNQIHIIHQRNTDDGGQAMGEMYLLSRWSLGEWSEQQ